MRSPAPRALGILVALALGLSGCIGKDAPAATSPASHGEPLSSAILPGAEAATEALNQSLADVPVWKVGDAWQVTTFGSGSEETAFFVVTRDEGDSYVVEPTSEQVAGYDAMYDVSFVGKIRASDLAGYQHDQPVQFFSFPLEDGKTWTARWDGYEIALAATKSARGFDIVGTLDGEVFVTYDFVPELNWWSKLEFAGGYGFRVERFTPDWTGTLATATARLLYESASVAPVLTNGAGSFTMSEGQTYGLVTIIGGGAHWARGFMLFDPTGAPHMTNNVQNAEVEGAGPREVFLQEQIPPTPGEWRIAAPAAHDAEGFFLVTVHEVLVAEKPFP